ARMSGHSPDFGGRAVERLGCEFADREAPRAGEDGFELEFRARLLFGRKFECEEAGTRVGEVEAGIVARDLDLECRLGTYLAGGKQKRGRIRRRGRRAHYLPPTN